MSARFARPAVQSNTGILSFRLSGPTPPSVLALSPSLRGRSTRPAQDLHPAMHRPRGYPRFHARNARVLPLPHPLNVRGPGHYLGRRLATLTIDSSRSFHRVHTRPAGGQISEKLGTGEDLVVARYHTTTWYRKRAPAQTLQSNARQQFRNQLRKTVPCIRCPRLFKDSLL